MKNAFRNYRKEQIAALVEEQGKMLAQVQEELEEARLSKERLKTKAQSLEEENVSLRYQVEQFKKALFGPKSERFTNAPAELPELPFETAPEVQEEIEEEAVEKITYERKKRASAHSGRQPLPEGLPVEEVKIYPEGDLSDMDCIGEEVTETLECRPAQLYIKRIIRYKYAPKNKEGVVIGKLPARFIPKGIAGNSLLVAVTVDKYMDHNPLNRQLQQFKRGGILIAASTMEGWVRQTLDMIQILYDFLRKTVKSKGYLQADETTIKVQDSGKKGKCHLGYYWVYNCPIDKVTLFDYQPGRGTKYAAHILDDFKGYLQTDGYAGYGSIGRKDGVVHLFCWAHARREFDRALSNDKKRSEIALAYIQKLYAVEAEAREKELSPRERKELRLAKSLPVLEAFERWLLDIASQPALLPKNQFGKAVKYALSRWRGLKAYLQDGSLEIDNNLVENAIRPVALGRKNYLFAGSHDAARRAAAIYSFFSICKRHDVNPHEWLAHVLQNLSETKVTDLHLLFPQNFKKRNEP